MATPVVERQHLFTFEDYVEVAERTPTRVEFWDGVILDMTGGTPRHSAICSNIGRILGAQLRGKPCRVFDSNLKVRSLAANRVTFADVTIVCGALERDPGDRTRQTVLNPTVLVEVISPSTETDDKGAKLVAYQLIPSVRAIVMVEQLAREITVHERRPDGAWSQTRHTDGIVAVPGIDCTLALAEVYEDLPED